jgi:hypothetical protein
VATARRPPSPLGRALALLAAGRWRPAHEIVQDHESPIAAWLHGIVHTLEGDLDNARYWYRKAGRRFPGRDHLAAEIAAARRRLRAAGARRRATARRSRAR